MEKTSDLSMLFPLGAGIAIGGLGLWALIELWPLIIIGAGVFIAFKGLSQLKESE